MCIFKELNNFVKRLMDILISFPAILVFTPIWIILGILIRKDSPGPAMYIHTRVGKDGKEFQCFKFRSMKVDAHPGKLAESDDDERITKFGLFIRNSSLDETPQLINVLLGNMSIVGPRPALPVQVKHFSEEEMWKIKVKPGITGWTQVNGRNSIPYEKRMELDCWYAKNNNVFLDLFIILKTFKVLLFKEGVYDPGTTSPAE